MTELKIVPKKTVSQEIKENIIKLLEDLLKQANDGSIETIIVICKNSNNEWINKASETEIFSESIGRLKITKQEWIKKYLENE